MIAASISNLLRKTQGNAALAEKMRGADSYEAVADLAVQNGESATADEARAAFAARSARVLGLQMIHAGLIERTEVAPAPAWNQEAWDRAAALDLSTVVTQMVNRKGWSMERAAAAERRYRRFLCLIASVPDLSVVPTLEVDEFWHQHILNTKQYAADCRRLTGNFVHHLPSSGASEQESDQLADKFFDTWLSYETVFAEPYAETIGEALLKRWPKLAMEYTNHPTQVDDATDHPAAAGMERRK